MERERERGGGASLLDPIAQVHREIPSDREAKRQIETDSEKCRATKKRDRLREIQSDREAKGQIETEK